MTHTSRYRQSIEDNGYEVTPEQRAAHMHILDRVVPARHELRELVQFLGQYGALDAGEAQQLRDAIGVLDGLCVPIALLKVVEDPHQTAAASLFSNTLRSRAPNDHDIDVAPPGMR